jgi:hypothetical protein
LTEALTPEEFQEMAISLTSGEGESRVYGSAKEKKELKRSMN